MIGQSNHEAPTESRANVAEIDSSLNESNDPSQVSCSHVDIYTLEKTLQVHNEVKWIV